MCGVVHPSPPFVAIPFTEGLKGTSPLSPSSFTVAIGTAAISTFLSVPSSTRAAVSLARRSQIIAEGGSPSFLFSPLSFIRPSWLTCTGNSSRSSSRGGRKATLEGKGSRRRRRSLRPDYRHRERREGGPSSSSSSFLPVSEVCVSYGRR